MVRNGLTDAADARRGGRKSIEITQCSRHHSYRHSKGFAGSIHASMECGGRFCASLAPYACDVIQVCHG